MRLFLPAFSLLAVATAAAETPFEKLSAEIVPIIRRHFPAAEVTVGPGRLIAKHQTMQFTVHGVLKDGTIRPKPHQEEGPQADGFVLGINLQEGSYGGAALVPQELRQPYWTTYFDAPSLEGGKHHFQIAFSYGSRLPREFQQEIRAVLPVTKR